MNGEDEKDIIKMMVEIEIVDTLNLKQQQIKSLRSMRSLRNESTTEAKNNL